MIRHFLERCRPTLIAVALLSAMATCGFIAPAWGDDVPARSSGGASRNESESTAANLSRSLSFVEDREAGQVLTRAENELRGRRFAEVAAAAQTLLDAPDDGFVWQEGRFRSSRAAAYELLDRLAEVAPDAYERHSSAAAEKLYAEALRSGSEKMLRDVVDRYRRTTIGTRALEKLAVAHLDRGERVVAAQLCLNTALDVTLPASVRTRALIRAVLVDSHAMEEMAPAVRLWERLGSPEIEADLGPLPAEWREMIERRLAGWDIKSRSAALDVSELVAAAPAWRQETPLGEEFDAFFSEGLKQLLVNGMHPLPSTEPVLVGDRLIGTTLTDLVCVDAQTGEVHWKRPLGHYGSRHIRDVGGARDLNRKRVLVQAVLHRVFGDGVYNRLATNGSSVLAIAIDNEAAPKIDESPVNRIVCIDAGTGDENWTVREADGVRTEFLSPPAVHAQRVYAVAQTGEQISLVVLAADSGAQEELVSLGQQLGEGAESSDQDVTVPSQLARIVVEEGVMLCSTGAGALVAIDPTFHRVLWAYRYPRSDLPEGGQLLLQPPPGVAGYQSWSGWQRVDLHTSGGLVLLATPESEKLHALELATGRIAWTRPRGAGLYVAGLFDGVAIVVEPTRIVGVDAVSGEDVWSRETSLPAGYGELAGAHFVFPTRDGLVERVSLATMEKGEQSADVWPTRPTKPFVPITLTVVEDAVVASTPAGLSRLTTYDEVASALEASMLDATERLRVRSMLEQERGNWKEAISAAQQGLEVATGAEREQLETQLRQVALRWAREMPDALEEIKRDLGSSGATVTNGTAWKKVRLEQAAREKDAEAFATAWLAMLTDVEDVRQVWIEGHQRRCRLDRWLQGMLRHFTDDLAPDAAKALEERIAEALDERHLDEPELADWARLWKDLLWGRTQLLGESPGDQEFAISLGRRLALIDLTETESRDVAWVAASRLLASSVMMGDLAAADFWYRRVEELAKRREAAPEMADERPTLVDELQLSQWRDEQRERWGTEAPKVERRKRRSSDLSFLQLPVEAPSGSLWSRLTVEYDWPGGKGLRFSGPEWRRPWYLDLPSSRRLLGTEVDLIRGWGIGPLLILQAGSELYGITPFDDLGRPSARLVWPPRGTTVDTLGDRSNLMLAFSREHGAQRIGYPDRGTQRWDEFRHAATWVGPVEANVLVLQQGGSLLAIDPATGDELWRRYDLPERAVCFGDGERVGLLARDRGTLVVIDAVDGAVIESRDADFAWRDVLTARGRNVVLGLGVHDSVYEVVDAPVAEGAGNSADSTDDETPSVFRCVDPFSRKTIWEREEPSDTIPFEVNDKLLGLLTRRGTGQLIELETGETFATFRVEMPKRLQSIACLLVEGTYLVLVSGPVEDEQLVSAPQPRQGYRHPFVSGGFTAIDSETGEMRWQRPFDETVISIDQPRGLPIFVAAAARKFSPQEGAPHGGRVIVFDVRTGEELVRSESEYPMGVLYAVDGFLEERTVTVRTRYEVIELQYGSGENQSESKQEVEDRAVPGNAAPSLNKPSS